MKRSFVLALALIFAVCGSARSLRAQDIAGITGVVTDTNGDVIVGADVSLVNTSTRASYTSRTNALGSYRIANITPGPGYTLTLKRPGFAVAVVNDIYLTVATTRTQNVVMKAGAVSTEVQVSAADAEITLNTTDATIGNDLDVKLLNELPVQTRDSPEALFTLQPGITGIPGADPPEYSVTGARSDQSDVTVDGLDVNDIATGQTFLVVANAPVDAVEQFRGTVGGFTADAGPGGGGQFQLVTKSGGNHFHGDVNEYHRDTVTAANNWFNDEAGVPLAHYVHNQFGGQIGGPIKKDKLFFFFNFYDSRIAHSQSEEATVPLDSYRNGNVSYILSTAGCTSGSRQNTTPACIGQISQAQIKAMDPQNIGFSPVLLNFLNSRYPHANDLSYGDGVNTGGYRFNAPRPDNETNYVGRVDYMLRPTMRLFARATIEREDAVEFPQALPADPVLGNPISDRSYAYVVGHTWTIGSNKVNSFYYGDTIEKYNFPANFNPTGTTVLTFGAGVNAFLGNPYNLQETQKRRIPIPVVRDDFNWQKGSHSLAFGGDFKFIKTESQQVYDFNTVGLGLGGNLPALDPTLRPANIQGSGTATSQYDNAFTFALGRIANVASNYNYNKAGVAYPNGTGHTRRYRYYETDLYATDSWKVTRGLTLSYGLRYQLYSVPYEVSGAESIEPLTFDAYFKARLAQSATGTSGPDTLPFLTYNLGGKANAAGPLYQPSYKDFAPRFAFAYNPSFLPKTVINGGAGIVYDRTVLDALTFLQDQSSYLFQNGVSTPYGGSGSAAGDLASDPRIGANFAFTNPNTPPVITRPFTPYVSGGVPYGLANNELFNTVIDPNLKDPYSIVLNAGIQQQLPWNMIFKLSYAGRLGRRLLAQADGSQLVDFPDTSSGQEFSTAFGNLTQEMRAGQASATAQPWFEDQVGPGWTQILYHSFLASYIDNGDFADFTQALAFYGLIDYNVGMASQFSENTFYTNKGFSSYNAMLVTVDKNLSNGLRFDFNYTWSHSIDNTSLIANQVASSTGIGFLCDAARPRECRGNSDFDETHVVNGDFTYSLPVGKGRTFAADAPRWVNEVIGGWEVSGIPSWHSGVAFTAFSNAYVAGFANNAPAIFNGNRGVVQAHLHRNSDGTVNLFSNPTAANAAFSGPVGFTIGSRNNLRGSSAWGMDAGLAKTFPVMEGVDLKFRADAFNVFNHPTFALPNNDITNETESPFGQINSTTGAPRVVQLAVRVEF